MSSRFSLGSKITRKGDQFVADGLDKILPGNDLASKTAKRALGNSANRLIGAGLGFLTGSKSPFGTVIGEALNNIVTAVFRENDTRVRVGLSPGSGDIFYKDPNNQILEPLLDTDGVLFPFTPNINVSHSAAYAGVQPTHSNFIQHSYTSSSVDQITVVGEFVANNANEARYLLAVLHFMRSVTKMFFGQDDLRGTPPPVLRLSGYGPFRFHSIPVVLQAFTHDFTNDVDYIEVPLASASDAATKTMVPTRTSINMSLLPIYSRQQIRNFSLNDFARGNMIGKPGGRGGFI